MFFSICVFFKGVKLAIKITDSEAGIRVCLKVQATVQATVHNVVIVTPNTGYVFFECKKEIRWEQLRFEPTLTSF